MSCNCQIHSKRRSLRTRHHSLLVLLVISGVWLSLSVKCWDVLTEIIPRYQGNFLKQHLILVYLAVEISKEQFSKKELSILKALAS